MKSIALEFFSSSSQRVSWI